MSMPDSVIVDPLKIHRWITNEIEMQKIEDEMKQLGYDSDTINAHLKEFKRIKYAKRQSSGFTCIVIGAVLGFFSCVLSIINPFPEIYYYILYGLTSVAVLFIFAGLYYFLE